MTKELPFICTSHFPNINSLTIDGFRSRTQFWRPVFHSKGFNDYGVLFKISIILSVLRILELDNGQIVLEICKIFF